MAITIRNLSFSYDRRPVLEGLSLAVPDSSFVVFLGKNGSGKSTLVKIISGVLPYETGRVMIDGHELKKIPLKKRSAMMGYLPSIIAWFFLFPWRKWS